MSKWVQTAALVIACVALQAGVAEAIAIDGSIDALTGSTSSVDYISFTVTQTQEIRIDVLSWEENYGSIVDVNGDGEIAYFDTELFLFQDDGSLDAGDFIAYNGDSDLTFDDGSINSLDSYLSLTLNAGDYLLAIGAYSLSLDEALLGVNSFSYLTIWDGSHFVFNDHGDYRVTLTSGGVNESDIRLPNDPPPTIPEPATVLLLGCGLLALLTGRERFVRRQT